MAKNSAWKRPSGNDIPTDNDFWKSESNNGRSAMGTSALAGVENLSADPGYGKLRPSLKGNPDTNINGGKGNRANDGKVGATYRIGAHLPGPKNEAQLTQANGKILPPTHSRSGSFYVQGVYDSTGR